MKKRFLMFMVIISLSIKLFSVEMISIQGGWFTMGDGKTELSPKHDVYVSSFEISPVEVTYSQFCNFINDRSEILDAYDKGLLNDSACADELGYYPPKFHYKKDWPMIRISFYTALLFCNWLSEKEGLTPCYEVNGWAEDISVKWNKKANGYRLPTEAEWEYAAGCGGIDLQMYDSSKENLNKIANYWDRPKNDELLTIASKQPNKFGLYDMLGNVWEWCWDYHNYYPENDINPVREDIALIDEVHLEFGTYNGIKDRIRKGGCKSSLIEEVSVTYRSWQSPWLRTYGITGVRVVRNAPDNKVFTHYVNDNHVRIRQTPGLEGKILTSFDSGTSLEIIKEEKILKDDKYSWFQIRTKTNVIGWMYGEFISKR